MTKAIPADTAKQLLYSKEYSGIHRVSITDDGTGRWTSYHTLVVTFDDTPGKFFATPFDQGLTENQDIQPFEYDEEVEFEEVEPFEVTTTEYRPVKVT
jgi:hypothetical protein